jgi:peptidoglycan/LPS O-acetylase OafA/YrhL
VWGGGSMLIYSGLISFVSMVVLFFLTNVKNISIPLVAYAGFFPVWIVFFVLGLYLGKNKIQLSTRKLMIFTILGLLVSVAETYFNIWYTGRFTGLGIKTGAFIYSFLAIVFLFSLNTNFTSDSIIWKVLEYIGKISFGIYLTHMYFMSYLVKPIVSHIQINNWLLQQFVIISLTLVFCMIMIYIAKKINKSFAVKYFGF